MSEMAAELGENQCDAMEGANASGELSSGAAAAAGLLGLSIDEFGSRLRHSMHAGHKPGLPRAPHVHVDAPTERTPQSDNSTTPATPPATKEALNNHSFNEDLREAENQIVIGFLMFAALYLLSSVLLLMASIYQSRCMAVPWLVAHFAALSAQTAVLVSQISAAGLLGDADGDEASRPAGAGAHVHQMDHHSRVEPTAFILSTANLTWLIVMWTIVIVAVRVWAKRTLRASPVAAPGDESFALSGEESFVYLETIK